MSCKSTPNPPGAKTSRTCPTHRFTRSRSRSRSHPTSPTTLSSGYAQAEAALQAKPQVNHLQLHLLAECVDDLLPEPSDGLLRPPRLYSKNQVISWSSRTFSSAYRCSSFGPPGLRPSIISGPEQQKLRIQ